MFPEDQPKRCLLPTFLGDWPATKMESLTPTTPIASLFSSAKTPTNLGNRPPGTLINHPGALRGLPCYFPHVLFRVPPLHLTISPRAPADVASGDEGFISIACSLGSLSNKIDGSSHVSGKPSREAAGSIQLFARLVFKC